MISIINRIVNYIVARRLRQNFSENVYIRHSVDLRRGLARAGIKSGYEHYTRHSKNEDRPHTYRRLKPGMSFKFEMPLPERALSGFQIYIANENSGNSDFFDLIIRDNGIVIFKTNLPYGVIALDRSTYIHTGAIAGLSKRAQVEISIPSTAENDIWLMTAQRAGQAKSPFEGTAFFDDPNNPQLGPIGLSLSPVSQCNQNCPHCISKFSRKSFSKWNEKIQKEIIAFSKNNRINHISVDYSGDPFFTNSRYFPLFDFIDEIGCQFRIDTNGGYIDSDTMRRVASGRLYELNFSLDAATGPTHSLLRPGKIPFEQILDNIKLAIRTLKELGRHDVLTSASFSLMNSNINEAIRFVELCKYLGLKAANFHQAHIYQDDTGMESLSINPERYNNIYDDLLESLNSSGLSFMLPPPYFPGLETFGRRRCTAPWQSAVILSNGDVQACCVPGTKIGNLNEKSFDEIWLSKEAQSFRTQAVSPKASVCGRCAFFSHRGVTETLLLSQ